MGRGQRERLGCYESENDCNSAGNLEDSSDYEGGKSFRRNGSSVLKEKDFEGSSRQSLSKRDSFAGSRQYRKSNCLKPKQRERPRRRKFHEYGRSSSKNGWILVRGKRSFFCKK